MRGVGYASRLNQDADVGGTLGEPEVEEEEDVVRRKAELLADLLKTASSSNSSAGGRRGCVAHTGAGISREAGIPDFRGPNGVWTRRAAGLPAPECETTMALATPTLTHMALVGLQRAGYVERVVSCNVDCLHVRSGLDRERLSELHGNCFAEACDDCEKEYIRDFEMTTVGFKRTGRACDDCGRDGRLRDKVLDWGDPLPKRELFLAERDSASAALSLVLGSSLQIKPSCDIPLKTTRKRRRRKRDDDGDGETKGVVDDAPGKLVIVNLQPTCKDAKAHCVINAKCDVVMSLVCARLGVRVPDYVRRDVLRVQHAFKASPSGAWFAFTLRVVNAHDDRAPIPWLARVEARVGSETTVQTLDRPPFTLKRKIRDDGDGDAAVVPIELTFHFQPAGVAAASPARRVYDVSCAGGETSTRFSFETYRKSYAA
jgi:mono-ADP-ribosyltransferase sirtuin 6